MKELPPILNGTAEQQLQQLREYLMRLAMTTEEERIEQPKEQKAEKQTVVKAAAFGTAQLAKVFPVGAVYISTVATNPADLFGFGTWQQIKDSFLLAAGDSYTAGATGGEAKHTLTVDEMPSHEGHMPFNTGAGWGDAGEDTYYMPTSSVIKYSTSRPYVVRAGNEVVPRGVSKGGSQPHNNMPPYLAVYVWQRIS